ncbi:MAG: cytochrome c oxidase assembly protein, partial [Mesorhizobium sp.]
MFPVEKNEKTKPVASTVPAEGTSNKVSHTERSLGG